MRLDPADWLAIAGVLLVGGGVWWIYPPAALIVIGLILLGTGLALA
jgi:hypothetical protein